MSLTMKPRPPWPVGPRMLASIDVMHEAVKWAMREHADCNGGNVSASSQARDTPAGVAGAVRAPISSGARGPAEGLEQAGAAALISPGNTPLVDVSQTPGRSVVHLFGSVPTITTTMRLFSFAPDNSGFLLPHKMLRPQVFEVGPEDLRSMSPDEAFRLAGNAMACQVVLVPLVGVLWVLGFLVER